MRTRTVTLALAVLLTPAMLFAATRFVRGSSGVFGTYAILERNGVEYKTNEVHPVVNQKLWAELSTADRRALIAVYDWRIGRRIDDFGKTTSDEMGAWIDAAQGWTAAAEALKAKHANKSFPELAAVFGPDKTLTLPDISCLDAAVLNSAEYKEAARLAKELQYDFAVGQGLYNVLVNAKWDQIGIATKAISADLIEIIVDNFMTGFITNGAAKTADLIGQVLDPVADKVRDIVLGRVTPGVPPPDPVKMIETIDGMMADLSAEANSYLTRVQTKQTRLESLAATIRQRCTDSTKAKTDAASALRTALATRANTRPSPAIAPVLKPANPEGTEQEKYDDIRAQAIAWMKTHVYDPSQVRTAEKNAAVQAVVDTYRTVVEQGAWIDYPGKTYLADASNGFQTSYYEVMDRLSVVNGWVKTDIPDARTEMQSRATKLRGAAGAVTSVLDSQLPDINAIEAANDSMDAYSGYLGYTPSIVNTFSSLRDFGAAIDMAAKPDITADDLADEYQEHDAVADQIAKSLPSGASKRAAWMATAASELENLRFNWENSISWVIATARQIDRLHAHPYFKRNEYPSTTYGSVSLYRYSIDVDGIKAKIAAEPSRLQRERARMRAAEELIRMGNEESVLLEKLERYQKIHDADAKDLKNFYAGLYKRFSDQSSSSVHAEFAAEGRAIPTEAEIYNAIVPDITYYKTSGWIRNRSILQTSARYSAGLVSGKILEYYDLLDLYQSMDVERSRYLAMTTAEFDAFMTDVTKKTNSSNGTWTTAFQMNGVYGVEYPCWQLLMKTNARVEELNAAYRGYPPPPVWAWDIEGTVTTGGSRSSAMAGPHNALAVTSGVGVPNVDVVLTGYLTTSTRSDSNGRFRFTWIGSGTFDVEASGLNYQFDQPTNVVTVAEANTTTAFTAAENDVSGYFVMGRITDGSGAAMQGVSVALTSGSTSLQQTTASDGSYRFENVPPGNAVVRPAALSVVFAPASRSELVNASLGGLDFVGTAGTAAPALTVSLSGSGTGRVTGSGIDCPSVCTATYEKGAAIRLVATPAGGSTFTGWRDRCSGTGACDVTMDDIRLVTAEFDAVAAADTTPPTIGTFSIPATSQSLMVSLTFSATDNVGVTGFLVTTDTSQPAPSDSRWTSAPPATFTFGRVGVSVLYGWARDAAGNVAAAAPASVSITIGSFAGDAPAGLSAVATTTTRVSISWNPVTGATSYAVERKSPGTAWQVLGSTPNLLYADTTAAAGTAYLYRVTAGAGGVWSSPSAVDLATTVAFTDAPLLIGTPVRAAHFSQLRSAVALVRELAGLPSFSYTDALAVGTTIRAVHLTELREALEQACFTLGLPSYSYVDISPAGATVKTTHVQQLRDRLQ